MSTVNVPAGAALGVFNKTIRGVNFTAQAWPAFQAMEMGARVCDVFGEAGRALLIRAGSAAANSKGELDDAKHLAGWLLSSASAAGSSRAVAPFVKECFARVTSDVIVGDTNTGRGPLADNADLVFTGRMSFWAEVFAWVVCVSFTQPDEGKS